jgi:hypothetical protein
VLHRRDAAPLAGRRLIVNLAGRFRASRLLPETHFLRSETVMDESRLTSAFERAERAILRIERAISEPRPLAGRDDNLRERVREAVAELDQIIRQAENA